LAIFTLIIKIIRIKKQQQPSYQPAGITRAIAQQFAIDFDPLCADPAQPYTDLPKALATILDPYFDPYADLLSLPKIKTPATGIVNVVNK
jgi:hypothetical protein